jgi:hypothetical protein
MKKILFLLSLFFVILSFSPSLYEIYHAKDLPESREFVLEHNYMFDYNFYLSRIREGQEGRFLVVEKYYNQPHQGSLFQISYLLMGKIGGLFSLSPPVVYHAARLILGFILLFLIGRYVMKLFSGWWPIVVYLFAITAGSWPILVKIPHFWRFATYMGWWSASDSLQRITFLPHVILGQIFILLFIWRFSDNDDQLLKFLRLLIWGMVGFVAGIIFPPTLIVVYTVFGVMSFLEILFEGSLAMRFRLRVTARIIFILLSSLSFVYLQLIFKVKPWNVLALFDVKHRTLLPYMDYALSLGPMLPLGILGLIIALFRKEKKLTSVVSWVLSIGILFFIFEYIPQQSPLRFTEAAINIPLGILAAYLLLQFWKLGERYRQRGVKVITVITVIVVISLGLGVMVSMVGWLTDQAYSKRTGSWTVPTGTQLIYPLKDFMAAIYFLRDQTKKEAVVLTSETAGNFIPAYSGNFVYLGHANTPNEEEKRAVVQQFFAGKMTKDEAKEFLQKERISYIYFGPQEKEAGNIKDLGSIYPLISPVYSNNQVVIYKVN